MFHKLFQIFLVVGCLAFGASPDRIPEVDISHLSYRLPNDTRPETYNISLRTRICDGDFNYDGLVSIQILVMNATRNVTIHSHELSIHDIQLIDIQSSSTIDLLPWRINSDTDFLIIPTENAELQPGNRYRLDIKFSGELNTKSVGFYRVPSDYDEDVASKRFKYIGIEY